MDLDSVFQQALAEGRNPDILTYLSYADHLRFRRQPDRCLEVIDRALRAAHAQGPRRAGSQLVMGLHTVAAEMILARVEDAARFDKAGPHIQALLDSPDARSQAVGHLLRRLDRARPLRAGATAAGESAPPPRRGSAEVGDQRVRSSALGHLKAAAAALPDIAEAQARYGVALVLARGAEPRPPSTSRMRSGSVAWTRSTSSGPPGRSFRPAIRKRPSRSSARCSRSVEQGTLPRELEATLHLLQGELYQARRSPEDLKKAVEEFDQALPPARTRRRRSSSGWPRSTCSSAEYDRALSASTRCEPRARGARPPSSSRS